MERPDLTPAIVQDAETGRVLMLAWMDEEALRRTREIGRGVVLEPLARAALAARARRRATRSRSRSCATTATATRSSSACGRPGPTCHTGSVSCFAPWLWRRIKERQAERPPGSYVVSLLDDPALAARKVGEEGLEAALAGAGESDERLVEELADLWFHSYVLLAARGLDVADVEDELRRRIRA